MRKVCVVFSAMVYTKMMKWQHCDISLFPEVSQSLHVAVEYMSAFTG